MNGLRKFVSLFDGRKDAYGTGEGRWVKKKVTETAFYNHLYGYGTGLGIAPLMDDGTVKFAAIDLDEPDFDAAREMQVYLPGTSWVERSRSGNAHVWVFFNDPIAAWVVRGIMKEAILGAGKGAVEIFPKQDALMAGMLGNYINLPYYRGSERPVLKPGTDEPMPFVDFADKATASRNDPIAWRRRAEWLMIRPPEKREPSGIEFGEQPSLHICAEHIIAEREHNPVMEGHRSVVYFSLAKMLLNYEGFDEDEAWHMMELVNQASPDALSGSELRRIFNNAHRGKFTSTGCDDVLMQPYAHPDCPIAFPKRSNT